MATYKIEAKREHWYTVEIEATDEADALEQIRDWISDDFEDYETRAQWDFEVII